jgi:Protein of unknown function (DUF551)
MPENPWVSVKQRLPEVGMSVLVYDNDNAYKRYCSMAVAYLDSALEWCGFDGDTLADFDHITHWMDLPPIPADRPPSPTSTTTKKVV